MSNGERVEKTITPGPQLFHLRPTGLTLSGKIAQHSFAHGLGFRHHLAAVFSPLFRSDFGFALRRGDDFVSRCLRFVARRFRDCERRTTDRLGFPLGSLGPLARGDMGSLDHLRGFDTKRFSNSVNFELVGRDFIELGQTAREIVPSDVKSTDFLCGALQLLAHGRRVKSTTNQLELGRLQPRWVQIICRRTHVSMLEVRAPQCGYTPAARENTGVRRRSAARDPECRLQAKPKHRGHPRACRHR